MKKQLLTAFVALSGFTAQAQFWINQNVTLPYEGYINDMEVVNGNVAWGNPWNATAATPYTQDFVKTIDGGATWITGSVGAPAAYSISNIAPIDADTCYVCMWNSPGGAVYKTTDGGGTWTQVGANMFTQPTSFGNFVYFWDAGNGMAMGDPVGTPAKYELFLTTDAGATWTAVAPANIPSLTNAAEYGITNLFSAADDRVWFGTTYGDVYRSIDGGATWTKAASGFPAYNGANGRQDISDIAFSDSLNGIITQTNATTTLVRRTTDGGLTWTAVTPAGSFFTSDIEGVPGTNFFVAAGSNATGGFGTSFSNDGGLNWNLLDTLFSHTAIDFVDVSTGFGGEYILAGSTAGGAWKFNGTLTSGPLNDECSGATDITSMFGQTPGTVITTGPYDNTTATTGPLDPTTGFTCFGEPDGLGGAPSLDNTLWFTFVGDGGNYFIEAPNNCAGVTNALTDGDSQIAIYTGTCGNWTPVACNEDGPNAVTGYYPAGLNFQTTAGTTYYMIVDGFNFNGALSTGEFCLNVTSLTSIACGNATISSGTSTPNVVNVCADSLFTLTTTGITAPNTAPVNGFSIIVSSGDITGSVPPFTGMLGGTGTISVGVNATQATNLVNNGAVFAPGIYYFTPVVYGNATGTGNITALTLDPACTYLGTSVMVNLLAAGDPLCLTGINDVNGNGLSAYVAVKDHNNFVLNINSHKNDIAKVSIIDVAGRTVYNKSVNVSFGENSENLNVTSLSTGTYMVKVETGSGTAVTKLIKL